MDEIKYYNNITVDKSYPLGSISCGYYKKQVSGLPIKYDICIISQLPNHFSAYRDKQRSISVLDTILLSDQYILDYVLAHKLKLCVQLRTNKKEEIDYYNYKFGNSADLILRKDSSFYTYKTMGQSRLVIGFNSSCVLEAWALGRKALCVDFTGTKNYNVIMEDLLIVRNPASSFFEKHLDYLFSMSMEEYIEQASNTFKYYIGNDDSHQPHEVIKLKINELLN